jgi:Mn2+/Fe2+ NRAMP family transporter
VGGVEITAKRLHATLLVLMVGSAQDRILVNSQTVLEVILIFLSTFLTTPTCVSHSKENRDLPSTLSPVNS